MLNAFSTLLAVVEGEAEKSKTPFYILGCVFGAWAIVLFLIGQKSQTFPSSRGQAIGLGAVSVALAVAAGALAVVVG